MPPLLRSDVYSYITQDMSTALSRYSGERQQTSPTPLPYRYTDKQGCLVLTDLAHKAASVARCSVAVHHEALFILYLYLYLYIYEYIYKYKTSFRHLPLLENNCNTATLQHCAELCALKHQRTFRFKKVLVA